ncbi:hypothetical protein OPV22_005138 [Ensete ventricosum]|uniref:Glucan endo-1,3-beta-D-glucosidase n=1 Tax=Ensete ventricosum TaxID=4639 RepID=A0AAV8Q0H2_ENSVE|nr:hypothetical protein OPV22_005138 [Ensete ventricosum]
MLTSSSAVGASSSFFKRQHRRPLPQQSEPLLPFSTATCRRSLPQQTIEKQQRLDALPPPPLRTLCCGTPAASENTASSHARIVAVRSRVPRLLLPVKRRSLCRIAPAEERFPSHRRPSSLGSGDPSSLCSDHSLSSQIARPSKLLCCCSPFCHCFPLHQPSMVDEPNPKKIAVCFSRTPEPSSRSGSPSGTLPASANRRVVDPCEVDEPVKVVDSLQQGLLLPRCRRAAFSAAALPPSSTSQIGSEFQDLVADPSPSPPTVYSFRSRNSAEHCDRCRSQMSYAAIHLLLSMSSCSKRAVRFCLWVMEESLADAGGEGIGVNYGLKGDNLPTPEQVVGLYKSRNIGKLRLFEPDLNVLNALHGSGIQVIVGTVDGDVQKLATDASFAESWVQTNIVPHAGSVTFRCVSIGNEIIPSDIAQYIDAERRPRSQGRPGDGARVHGRGDERDRAVSPSFRGRLLRRGQLHHVRRHLVPGGQ